MGIEIIAYKCGMTRFFTDDGISIPVTVVKIYNNYVMKVNKINNNDLSMIISAYDIKEQKLNKPLIGVYKKLKINNCKYIRNLKIKENWNIYKIGEKIPITIFNTSEKINITGISKGKGFAGTIKRHNFSAQRATHGNSLSHRVPGSIGQCQSPGRVFKGKKMAGRLGNEKTTIKNLEVIKIYADLNTLLIKGAIPGANGSKLILKKIVG